MAAVFDCGFFGEVVEDDDSDFGRHFWQYWNDPEVLDSDLSTGYPQRSNAAAVPAVRRCAARWRS
jgi:hypothetical protein